VDIKDIIEAIIDKDAKILMVGCGNAPFSYDMYVNIFYRSHFRG